MTITNDSITRRRILQRMYDDGYFPDHLVDKARTVLEQLAIRIESDRPADLAGLYELTHAATEEINDLQDEFEAAGSELETEARESFGDEFRFVAQAYGFHDADPEELIAPRDW